MSDETPAGWYPDPAGSGQYRWFDGTAWTETVESEPQSAGAAPRLSGEQLESETRAAPPVMQDAPYLSTSPAAPAYGSPPGAFSPPPRKKSRLILWLGVGAAVVLVIVIVVVAQGLGSGGESHRYPAQVETNFLTSCHSSGGTPSQCHCALSHLEEKLSLEQILADEDIYRSTGRLPEEVLSAVRGC
jgi:hypothetical protein